MTMIHILLIEDDALDARLFVELLGRSSGNYHIEHAGTLESGLVQAETGNFAVILTDLTLPDSNSLESVSRLRKACKEATIIVHSGSEKEQLQIEALESGADDFLCKNDANSVTLHRCIQQNLLRVSQRDRVAKLLVKLEERNHKVERQAVELAAKNKRLAALCDASKKFVNHVSHEFRTPLCVIQQYSGILADELIGPVNEEQKSMLRIVEARVDELSTMVDDMLDISRLESGLLTAKRKCFDVKSIVRELIPTLQQKATPRNIDICLDIDDEIPDVFGDSEKLSRTLINLVVNAIKFSAVDDSIAIRVHHREDHHDVLVSVRDNGPGIPIEQQQQLFQRFRQASSGLESTSKGFGLGLSIAKELVELNLGEMTFSSTVGQGSDFCFTIPIDSPQEIAKRYLSRMASEKDSLPFVSVFDVVPASANPSNAKELNDLYNFLNLSLRSRDLLLPTSNGRWLLFVNMTEENVQKLVSRIETELIAVNRNRPAGKLPDLEICPLIQTNILEGGSVIHELVDHRCVRPPFLSTIQQTASGDADVG
jgi:signal transduction histidine kinase